MCSYLSSSSHPLFSKSGPYIHPEAKEQYWNRRHWNGTIEQVPLLEKKKKKKLQQKTREPHINMFLLICGEEEEELGSQFIQSVKNSFRRIPVNSFKTSRDRVHSLCYECSLDTVLPRGGWGGLMF